MPVPKAKQEFYGKVVGRNIKSGKSMREAKMIADKALNTASASEDTKKNGKKAARDTARSGKRSHAQR